MFYGPAASHATAAIYIAGPEVLYRGGDRELAWMRKVAEARGFRVTLPNDDPLALGNADRRRDADAIFENCAAQMNASDTLICDLDFFRGTEPDGGSVYEIGMAHGRGLRIICFTRDKRAMALKDPHVILKDGEAFDREGRRYPYAHLPFAPTIVGSSKIVEGDFDDALRQLQVDLEEESKSRAGARRTSPGMEEDAEVPPDKFDPTPTERPFRVYFAGPDRFRFDAAEVYSRLRELCVPYGWEVITPADPAPGVIPTDDPDPWVQAYHLFDRYQQHVRDCDVVIADLNDYHGWEPNSDTSFEAGLGFQLGKRLFGYMADTRRMIDRIPNRGQAAEYADLSGAKAENFDYPINLMFASSMPILCGSLEDVLPQIAADLGTA